MRKAPKKNGSELSIKDKLVLLRKKFRKYQVDAFLVPHNDMYFNEITAPFHNRLEWITGFTGSAGFAIIFKSSAVVFTDGRYSIQIQQEVNNAFFKIENISKSPPFSWLKKGGLVMFFWCMTSIITLKKFPYAKNNVNAKG